MCLRWLLFPILPMMAIGQTTKPAGDYAGMIGPLHVKLHLVSAANGELAGTLDSIDQGANGLPCANFHLERDALTFEVPSVGGKWHGTVSGDGQTLTGMWSQGAELPSVFKKDVAFAMAEKPTRVDGIWLGALEAGGAKLRVQIRVKSDRSGKEFCSLDSLDQGATGLPCDNVLFDANRFSFDVPAVHGHWTGALSDEGNQLNGTWSQGSDLPLKFTRQSTALAAEKPKAPRYDDAMAPASIENLKSLLDKDLAETLKQGALSPETKGGVVIGVVQHGKRRIFAYGDAKENSLFEIGSISKTFTGLILAQMVEQNKVKLDEPVRDLLPAGTAPKAEGSEITLIDLATQHSGLPRMPDNFHSAHPEDPYADYGPARLYEFVGKHGLRKPANASFGYSNLGLGLLGQALSNRAEMRYPELLKRQITGPLGMNDTVVTLTPEQEARFAQGHDGQHRPAQAWSLDALAGAGAIRSTAADMLTYLEAEMHPESASHMTGSAGSDAACHTLASALHMSQQLRADSLPGMKIGFAWLYDTESGNYWHNGATGGYSSYALFNFKEDYALVVLFNTTLAGGQSFADRLGEHVAQRLTGKPAISLAP